ncbi:hypothetical protein CONPUDRAFT_75638 [Coniophora puteana RWD-64-598 SS2]|uniref:Uncharacterized protein n=1 Tax=Coniophora puteana (strain RWD-64-598) TaxID=741705 RepID=A0A5M3MFD1_CONPW|nr:uncharacterized protein CONPUDRAFT_75638 [Coniophora puteana RWD-64-598 SS2]EIW77863.1 hypothetical protein CONPUDRAFT_75638 [Coniophora puteana RWD-64-598 SS2]
MSVDASTDLALYYTYPDSADDIWMMYNDDKRLLSAQIKAREEYHHPLVIDPALHGVSLLGIEDRRASYLISLLSDLLLPRDLHRPSSQTSFFAASRLQGYWRHEASTFLNTDSPIANVRGGREYNLRLVLIWPRVCGLMVLFGIEPSLPAQPPEVPGRLRHIRPRRAATAFSYLQRPFAAASSSSTSSATSEVPSPMTHVPSPFKPVLRSLTSWRLKSWYLKALAT